MAQAEYDHRCNMLSNPVYADRCRRKRDFRRRTTFIKDFYQVDEDVWARHPTDGYMYIASVDRVDIHHMTCQVTFVDNNETLILPIAHVRHVTIEDIERERYVDYGNGWSEPTQLGAIASYDRYGQLITISYDSHSCFSDDSLDQLQEVDVDSQFSSNIRAEPIKSSVLPSERIWIRIPDPDAPTTIYSMCGISGADSYDEAEKRAFQLLEDDKIYLEALRRSRHRPELNKLVSFLLTPLDSSVPSEQVLIRGPPDVIESPSTSDNQPIDFMQTDSLLENTTVSPIADRVILTETRITPRADTTFKQSNHHLDELIHETAHPSSATSLFDARRDVLQILPTSTVDGAADEKVERHENTLTHSLPTAEARLNLKARHPMSTMSTINTFPPTSRATVLRPRCVCSSFVSQKWRSLYSAIRWIAYVTILFGISYRLSIENSSSSCVPPINNAISPLNFLGFYLHHHRIFVSWCCLRSTVIEPSRSTFELWPYPFAIP
jgi:hypothetical protein